VNDNRPLTRVGIPRFARRVVAQQPAGQLALMDRWIADEQRREGARQRRLARGEAAPDGLIERGPNGPNAVYVHVGPRSGAGRRAAGAGPDQAVRALTDGGAPACPLRRPDTVPGNLA
jgi:hypothetical protein